MSQALTHQVDMLHGPLLRKIVAFALPFAASSVLQQLFNSVDVAVVGQFASSEALAAVGTNGPVINLLINLFVGIALGANVILANHIGQKDNQRIQQAIRTVSVIAVVGGVFLMVLGWVVSRPILTAMDTPPNILDDAVLYLRIIFLGVPFTIIYNFGAAILRSMGDTKRPLYTLIVAGIVNTVLNLILVIVFHLGVAGVAIATAISNLVSAGIICLLLTHEDEPFKLHLNEMRIDSEELRRILQIGIPAGLQGMVFSFSNVILQSAINGFGSDAVAGSAAALNFEAYCYFLVSACNGAAITFIGQNYGAGQCQRCKRIFWICMAMSVVACGFFNLLFATQASFFLHAFSFDPNVVRYGEIRMHVVLVTQAMASSYEIAGSCLRGLGKSMLPAILTIFGTCVLRIAWVYLLLPHYHDFGILLCAYPVSWFLTGCMVLVAWFLTSRKLLAHDFA